MNKLISLELKKIFHKKAIYIIFILIVLLVLLNSILILTQKPTEENNYLDNSLKNYEEALQILENYKEKGINNYQEKLDYYKNLSTLKLNQYMIETKHNINDYTTLNYQFQTTLEDYEILIVILILIVSSTILAEEMNKGTIKLLLIKPYTRTQILLSKYLTIIIILFLSILFLYTVQLLLGGFFLGFHSLTEKVVIYNYEKSQIMCYNIVIYAIIRVISKLPMLLLLATLSFMISIVTSNSIVSLTLPILIYMFSESINTIAISYNLKIMKYLLTTNWNFTQYLFGNIPTFQYISRNLSIVVCIIYLLVMILFSWIIWRHKDIKNI